MLSRDILIYFALKYRGSWEEIYRAVRNKEDWNPAEAEALLCEKPFSALTILDEAYPACFRSVFRPPFVLFTRGDPALLKRNAVSIVGSRSASRYGIEATRKIVRDLKGKNCAVCSGMAKGVDRAAHEEALKCGIPTIGVLPCGIDGCYPKENLALYREVERRGLLISEYPGSVLIAREKFSFRESADRRFGDFLNRHSCEGAKRHGGDDPVRVGERERRLLRALSDRRRLFL